MGSVRREITETHSWKYTYYDYVRVVLCGQQQQFTIVQSCSRVINWGVVCPIDLCLVKIAIYVYHHHHPRPCFSVQVHGARALRTTGTCVLHHDLRQVEEGWRWNVAAPLGGGKLLWALLKVPETH